MGTLSKKFLYPAIFLFLFNVNCYSMPGQQLTDDPQSVETLPDPEDQLWDSAHLSAFFDQLFAAEMEEKHVPGATFCVVKDGKVVFKKGYGYANMDSKEAVDPDQTIFFAGSVSKLFTSTAIMQLYEQGKLDFNTDVNEYLTDLIIDNNFPEPVTVSHLLTHTGGFEERSLNLVTFDSSYKLSIYEYLSSGMQPRVLPPGKYLSYSNYGMTLAGFIVQEVSGTSFSEYITRNILQPLEMRSSSFAYPGDLMARLATAYNYRNDVYLPLPVPYLFCSPAGALLTTANDMANFMIAHLQDGTFKDTSILMAETAVQMHSQLFTQHPELEGMCYGFYENFKNDLRIIQHAGDINGFGSLMVIIPEKNTGFFVSINGGKSMGRNFRGKLEQGFLDHFYPAEPPKIIALKSNQDKPDLIPFYRDLPHEQVFQAIF